MRIVDGSKPGSVTTVYLQVVFNPAKNVCNKTFLEVVTCKTKTKTFLQNFCRCFILHVTTVLILLLRSNLVLSSKAETRLALCNFIAYNDTDKRFFASQQPKHKIRQQA